MESAKLCFFIYKTPAARLLTGLLFLYWFPLHFGIDFKILLIVFKSLNGSWFDLTGSLHTITIMLVVSQCFVWCHCSIMGKICTFRKKTLFTLTSLFPHISISSVRRFKVFFVCHVGENSI